MDYIFMRIDEYCIDKTRMIDNDDTVSNDVLYKYIIY